LPERTILITGAAGNLGSLLARHLIRGGHRLRLMYHRTPLPSDIAAASTVSGVRADLADPRTLPPALDGAGVVVHSFELSALLELLEQIPEDLLPLFRCRCRSRLL